MPAKILYTDDAGMTTVFVPIGSAPDPGPVPPSPLTNQSRLGVGLTSQNTSNSWHLYRRADLTAYPVGDNGGVGNQPVFRDQPAANGTLNLFTDVPVDVQAVGSGTTVIEKDFPGTGREFRVKVPSGQRDLTLRYLDVNGLPTNNVKPKLFWPGYTKDTDSIFTDEAKAQCAPFGTIRFMDVRGTNGNGETTWETRPKVTDPSWGRACPWEVPFTFCNETGKNCWANIPHAATDDYVQGWKAQAESMLRPDVECFVEYGNEITFNSKPPLFSIAYSFLLADARNAIANNEPTVIKLNSGAVSETYTMWACYAQRVVEIQNILGPRFKMVMSGHIVNPSILKTALEYIEREHGAPKQFIHAIATAPYGGIGNLDPYPQQRKTHLALATKYGVKNFYYEFLYHNTSGGQAMYDAHAAPEAEQKTVTYLDNTMADADVGCIFVVGSNWTVKGDEVSLWGLTQGTHQKGEDSAKYRGAKAWAAGH